MTFKTIAIAADHGGFGLKPAVTDELQALGLSVLDLGTDSEESVDYPDFAEKLAAAITRGEADGGVLMCGTGIGISMAANRNPGIRAALCYSPETAALARQHNDANVLCLGARTMSQEDALAMLRIFFSTDFDGGRHARRVEKLGKRDVGAT